MVTEKNEKDETTLKVHIPGLCSKLCGHYHVFILSLLIVIFAAAQGETSTVRAWNLRASRSWIDGKWIEYSTSRGQNTSEQVI